jgi:arylsulfatase A-like enzyme
VIRWPEGVKRGVSDALVSQVDLIASVAAWSGQTLAPPDAPDSLDLMPAFLGRSRQGREHLIEQAGGLALRVGQWKYMEPSKRPRVNANTRTELGNDTVPQLYDLTGDPGETRNLADKHPSRVMEMDALLQQIRKGALGRTQKPALRAKP